MGDLRPADRSDGPRLHYVSLRVTMIVAVIPNEAEESPGQQAHSKEIFRLRLTTPLEMNGKNTTIFFSK